MHKKIIFFTYVLLVTALSLFPTSRLPVTGRDLFPHADKLVHFGMYAVFTFLLFYTWPAKFSGRARQFLPLLYVIIWGTLMEALQGVGGYGRNFSHLDIIANILGFFPGWAAWIIILKKPVSQDSNH